MTVQDSRFQLAVFLFQEVVDISLHQIKGLEPLASFKSPITKIHMIMIHYKQNPTKTYQYFIFHLLISVNFHEKTVLERLVM